MVCTTIEEAKRIWQHLRVACDPESEREGSQGTGSGRLSVFLAAFLLRMSVPVLLTVAMWYGRGAVGRAAQTNELLQALAVRW